MNNGKILVIEDDKSIRDVLEILLQSRGFQVEPASSGERGLAIVKSIAALHGGSVALNLAVSPGCQFEIMLPKN